jgi:hypothetical protein
MKYGIQEVKAEIAKTLRKHIEEHEAFLVELYKAHPPEVGGIPFHGSAPVKEKPKHVSPVFHSSAASGIPKGVSHGHPMADKKPVGKAACEKCGKSDCMKMGKCDMGAVKPEVKKASCEKCGKKPCDCEKPMSKSEFDELAAFVSTVSLYKGAKEDKNVNSGNEKMSSITDRAQGGKGPEKIGSTEEVSEGSGSGGDVIKGKLGKAAIPMAAPKAPSIPSAKPKAPAALAAAGPAGTKGDAPAKSVAAKSTHNIF